MWYILRLEGDTRVYENFEGKGLQVEYDTKKTLGGIIASNYQRDDPK